MPVIRTRINYRSYTLSEPQAGGTIGVITKDGDYKHFGWLGFIEIHDARDLPDARPVKLFANAYRNDELGRWTELSVQEAIMGCWQAGGVWAVLYEGQLRIVKRTSRDPYARD